MRPLRGGQGTFDKIIANVRAVAGKCRHLDRRQLRRRQRRQLSGAARLPRRAGVRAEARQGRLQAGDGRRGPRRPPQPCRRQAVALTGIIPLTPVATDGAPLGGTCMTVAGAGAQPKRGRAPCDSCHFVDETMGFLREETRKRGFPTIDGVHMGPCEIHRKHAHTIGPDGALYACPGFTGEPTLRHRPHRRRPDAAPGEGGRPASIASAPGASAATARSSPCAPAAVSVASHTELGDMDTPTCHRPSLESALVSLAADAAAAS